MNRQTAQQAQKETTLRKKKPLFQHHAAVRPVADHELPSNSSAAGLAQDLTQVPVRPSATMVNQNAFRSCPMSPQRCPFGGACHSCPPHVQAKLKIGQPGDKYEQEADRVAEQVMRMPEPKVHRKGRLSPMGKEDEEDKLLQTKPLAGQITPLTPSLQRKPESEAEKEEDEDKILQAKSVGNAGNVGSQTVNHPLIQNVLSSPGQPLDAGTRSFMEPRFGQDFSGVQVHTDGKAAESAHAVNARAFTCQNHIFFSRNQYQPGTGEGKQLLAHELSHTLQQGHEIQRKAGSTESEPAVANPEVLDLSSNIFKPSQGVKDEIDGQGGKGLDVRVQVRDLTEEEAAPKEKAEIEAAIVKESSAKKEGKESEAKEGSPTEGKEEPQGSDAEGKQRLEQVMKNLGKLTRQQQGVAASRSKSRATAKTKAGAASQAAPSPKNEATAHGKGAQVAIMDDEKKKGQVDKKSFLEMVKEKLRDMEMPKNPKQMGDFKKRGGGSALKGDVLKGAKEQQATAQGAIATATTTEPKPAKERSPVELPASGQPPRPRKIDSKEVLPPPKSEAEVSLENGRVEVEGEMAKEKLTTARFNKANDPRFTSAQEGRQEVNKHVEEGPNEYRHTEQETLTDEKAAVKAEEKRLATRMHSTRKQSDKGVLGRQKTQMSAEEKERQKIANDLDDIYVKTKEAVEGKLKWLDGEVDIHFTKTEKEARHLFEDYVEDEFDKWKDRRYSGARGKLRWINDLFRDINELSGAKQIYVDGQDVYYKKLDTGIDEIGTLIDTTLTWSLQQTKKGHDKVKEYLTSLKPSLKKLGVEAGQEVLDKFGDLKDQVNDHRDALADKLAQRYQESRQKLNARIEEIKDANRSLVVKAKRKIKAVIDAVKKFRTRLMSLLSKIRDVVEKIIDDPIGFLKNLLKAVKKGFDQFKKNIGKHLVSGIFGWLFGTFAGMGINLPKDFSPKSVVGFILQILGITWERTRKKAVRLIGRRNMSVIEKVTRYLSTLFTKGPGGLWKEIKGDLGNLKDIVIDSIKDWLITKIVTAAVTKLVSMFNPVGAIVQAVLTIYNVVMFFVERIDQILQLVKTVINALVPIVAGNIATAANFIERAMAQTLPLIIAFLARLLGLGGIAKRVKKIIDKVRRRVDRAIDKALKRIVKRFKGVAGKGKVFAKKTAGKIAQWWKKKKTFTAQGKKHSVSTEGSQSNAKLLISSSPGIPYSEFLKKYPSSKEKTEVISLAKQLEKPKSRKDDPVANADKKVALFNQISTLLIKIAATRAKLPPTAITFGSVRPDGGGTEMKASILSQDHPKGSSVQDKDTKIWTDLDRLRKGSGKASNPFIQGHLLNDNLGGPGRMQNLTPIRENANRRHLHDVEKHIKKWVGEGNVAYYHVKADYPSRPKRSSEQVALEKKSTLTATERKKWRVLKESFATKRLARNLTCTAWKLEYENGSWKKAKTKPAIPEMPKKTVKVINE